MKPIITKIFFIAFLLLTVKINAQTNRYWSNSFNTDASLLSGAVVGGGSGITAIYYNPAQIADISYKKFAITANIFSFYNTNFKNALEDGQQSSDLKFRVQPRFVAYLLRPEKWKNTSIEIATFTRDTYNFEKKERVTQQLDIISSYPGNEQYVADFYYRSEFNDYWIGGGIAKELSPKLKAGVSGFYSYSYLKYNYQVTTRAYNLDNPGLEVAEYNYDMYINGFTSKLLFKFGLTYSTKLWQAGIALTTPSIRITGSSEVSREIGTHNIHDQEGNLLTDLLITDYQEKLRTNFKSPLSISLGIRRKFQVHSIYLSGQYFSNLNEYNTIDNPDNTTLVYGDELGIDTNDWLSVSSKHKNVTNIAIGWRGKMDENLELMGGFRTDFSFNKYNGVDELDSPVKVVSPSIDQYHVTSGVQFEFLHSDIILGLQYSFSKEKGLEQFANFTSPVEYDPSNELILQGYRNNNMVIWENTLSIFLGFTYNINEKKSE